MRATGLGRGLSGGLARWRAPRAVHDPGKVIADLAAAVALGGDCLADIAVLREQPELAGPVASDPVVSRHQRAAGPPVWLTSRNRLSTRKEKPPGTVEPRPPGATAGQPGTARHQKQRPADASGQPIRDAKDRG
jgi:Transposase DDE domain group 1